MRASLVRATRILLTLAEPPEFVSSTCAEKKRERGDSLTAEQLELLKRFHSSEAAAEAERIIAGDAPAAAPAPAAGHKRRRDGKSGAPHIVTTTGSSKKSQGAAKASVVVALSLKAGGPSGKPKPVAVAAPAPAPAAPVFSVADKLSMSLDQLAALRKTTSPAAAAVPSGAQKKRK